MALPPFHAFGLVTQLYAPLSCLTTTVVYPPRTVKDPHAQPVIPTSDNILECVRETKCHYLMIVPTFLEQMVTSEEAIEVLKNTEFVVRPCYALRSLSLVLSVCSVLAVAHLR
jgi:acyl-CoA synthetase (AMP-forming)/AMP-acid ligase II